MTKKIAYQLCSQDPNNYGTVTFTPLIPWNCEKIMYQVTDLNTFGNIVLSTEDDYIMINEQLYHFPEKISWDKYELATWLNDQLSGVVVSITDTGCYQFRSSGTFTITECTHRVRLLLGIFHCNDFPIQSQYDEDNLDYCFIAPACPMLTYGNVLYLRTLEGSFVGTRNDIHNITFPCAYRINQFIKPGVPLLYHKKGEKTIINIDAAKQITMTLVDFMYEPVILKSPMFIAIKIKPVHLTSY